MYRIHRFCSPGVCSRCVCVPCCVCALWMGKCRARIQKMGHHTWLCHFTFLELSLQTHLLMMKWHSSSMHPTKAQLTKPAGLMQKARVHISNTFSYMIVSPFGSLKVRTAPFRIAENSFHAILQHYVKNEPSDFVSTVASV